MGFIISKYNFGNASRKPVESVSAYRLERKDFWTRTRMRCKRMYWRNDCDRGKGTCEEMARIRGGQCVVN